MRPCSAIPEAEMTTNGPCRSFSFFDSDASRMYCRRWKPNGSSPFGQVRAGLLVEAFRVVAVHVGDVHGERAVHEDRDVGDALFVGELVQQQHQLLGAPDRERRHDDAAAARRRPLHDGCQLVDRRARRACAAGRRRCFRGSGNRPAASSPGSRMIGRFGPPDVAGEAQAHRLAVRAVVQHHEGRAENVARRRSSRS